MKITVGIPIFNAEATLRPTLASIFNQTWNDFELILVDDGSTDRSMEIAKEAALRDPRVRVVSDGVNRGLSYRLNQIATLCQTPLLARMDADDVMHPSRLQVQREYILRSGADVVGCSAYVFDERMRVRSLRHARPFRTRADVLLGGGFIHPSILGWTEWFRRNPYDASYGRAEDVELWVRTVERSHLASLDSPLLFYREPSTPNLRSYRASWKGARKVLQDYRRAVSTAQLLQRITRTYAADVMYRLASAFPGATEALLARRSSPVPEGTRGVAEAILARASTHAFSHAGGA